jgi:23S rRNA (cytosine1962-C5)-methyltransferase
MTRRPAARSAASTVHEARLRKPLERALRAGHPWVFRDALVALDAPPGAVVRVLDKQGRFVAAGFADVGPIGVRVLTLRDEPVNELLLSQRIASALALRERIAPADTDALRLIHGEGDRLPGVVCDRYGRFAVLKLDGDAALAHKETWLALLRAQLPALGVEGLLLRTGKRQDHSVEHVWGARPDPELYVREHGMLLCVNLYEGQKTGLFLDHRQSRARVGELAKGLSVLNLYGYTGGFSVAAGLGGSRQVTTVDLAKPALELATKSWAANALPADLHQIVASDALDYLGAAASRGQRWELIVADPPNFAPRETARDAALRTYEALHAAVLRVLAPGGYYLAASCSSHVLRADFEETVKQGAARARRVLQILERTGAPADHPKLLGFPEGDYLKVLALRAF